MSNKTGTNGAAFPSGVDRGMSLRDYFAGQALPIWVKLYPQSFDRAAESAYKTADAMLKARGQ